ncbi:hypothetical protein AAFF_G00414710 [Aldrovandia affinis]|uniref:Uncharacterized protein n=1 Tax=Aldrovandia affinis TaxID=143900 RepID=A0AAD7SAM3_9TELE|nr:hypothetical protein AAFF_G00414710 [Aldrovandia affinis]
MSPASQRAAEQVSGVLLITAQRARLCLDLESEDSVKAQRRGPRSKSGSLYSALPLVCAGRERLAPAHPGLYLHNEPGNLVSVTRARFSWPYPRRWEAKREAAPKEVVNEEESGGPAGQLDPLTPGAGRRGAEFALRTACRPRASWRNHCG